MKRSLKFLTAITLSLLLVFGSSLGAFAAEKNTSIHLHADGNTYTVFVILEGNFSSNGVYDSEKNETTVPLLGDSLYRSTDFSIDVKPFVRYFIINNVVWNIPENIREGKEGKGTINYWMADMPTFEVEYFNLNENATGTPPKDTYKYSVGELVQVMDKNDLILDGHTFEGWTTNSNGINSFYEPQEEFYMPPNDVELYAKWDPIPMGTVTAYYWDEDEYELDDEEFSIDYEGKPYTTAAKNIPGYQLKVTPLNAQGYYVDGSIDVYYIYEPIQGTVMAHYLFGETKLHADVELIRNVGTKYETENKSFLGYELISAPENEAGSVTEETIHVYYYYRLTEEPQGTVIAHYWDEDDNELVEKISHYGSYDSSYKTNLKSIEDFQLKEIIGKETGVFGEEPINVYYIYEPIQGSVIVQYLFGEKKLNDDIKLIGDVKTGYSAERKSFYGYDLITIPENENGLFTKESIHVYYNYERTQGNVMVHYLFGETNLVPDIELSGYVNNEYLAERKSFDGYKLISLPENEEGLFTEETIHVDYCYELIPNSDSGSITVNKTITGDTPPSNSTFTFRLVGPAGETSTTRELSRTGAGTVKFEELTYGTYTLTEIGFPSNFSIVSGSNVQLSIHDETPNITANITNRYTEPTPPPPGPTPPPVEPTPERGTVRVHHIDIDEKILGEIFEFTGPVGTNYATAAREFEDLELVETPENASGTIIDGIIDVFYVYSPGVEPLFTLEVEEETPLGAPVVPEEEIVLTEPIPLAPLPQTGQLPAELFYGLGSVISMIGIAFRKSWKNR